MRVDECRPLTVREQFAVAALVGILTRVIETPRFASLVEIRGKFASEAWAMADAMLSAPEATPVPVVTPAPEATGREDDGQPE